MPVKKIKRDFLKNSEISCYENLCTLNRVISVINFKVLMVQSQKLFIKLCYKDRYKAFVHDNNYSSERIKND